ncbi:MAG: hypothetical protein ACPGO3_01475 [Magnetospiraceae bacterium]
MFDKIRNKLKPGPSTPPPPKRSLTKPEELTVGDFVEFGEAPLPAISGGLFKVEEANAVDYGDGAEPSFIITRRGITLGFSVDRSDGEAGIVVSRRLKRREVESTFDMEAFGSLFGEGYTKDIPVQNIAEELQPWIDPEGYRESVDCLRSKFKSGTGKSWEAFEYYELTGIDDDDLTVEIEVYPDDTEVYLCRWFPIALAEKLWPKKEGES